MISLSKKDKKLYLKIKKGRKGAKPWILFFLFGLILVIAALNIIGGLMYSKGIQPFGKFGEVLAAVRVITGVPAPNFGQLARGLSTGNPVEDSPDRCRLIDPHLSGTTKVSDANNRTDFKIIGENIGGANQAPVLNMYHKEYFDGLFAHANRLGFSYVLGMVSSPDHIDHAARFIAEANAAKLTPIIRLCYLGGGEAVCEFKSPDTIVSFYSSLSSRVTEEFIAMVGPNEPGTGLSDAGPFEVDGFVSGGSMAEKYRQVTAFITQAALGLQPYRVQNGGNLYLSPGAFNLSNTTNPDTVRIMVDNGLQNNLRLFDFLMGNAYDDGTTPHPEHPDAGASYKYYAESGLKGIVDNASGQVQTIITEFGVFDRNGAGSVEESKKSFAAYCKDENVIGVLFFRAMEGRVETELIENRHLLTDDEIEEIIGDCEGDNKNFGLADYAWQNCNFDSCLYDYSYSQKSTAVACGEKNPDPILDIKDGATLRIRCNGGPCKTVKQDTYQVSMPIKQFGSTSPAGINSHDYMSICANLAYLFDNSGGETGIDALNQFAGRLISKKPNEYGDYPMPWLGSAINCATEIIKRTPEFYNTLGQPNYHPGSAVSETNLEKESELSDSSRDEFYNLDTTSGVKQIDERVLCVDGNCFNKDSEVIDNNKIYREYLPLRINHGYTILNDDEEYPDALQCIENELKIRNDPKNYLPGPEIKLGTETVEWEGSGQDICQAYGKRNAINADPNFDFEGDLGCSVDYEATVQYEGAIVSCAEARCTNGLRYEDDMSAPIGMCDFPDYYKSCLKYAENEYGEAYRRTLSYPEFPEFDVPGMYDALHAMYVRMQNALSARGVKLVVRDNLGWNVKIQTKMRDVNRPYGEQEYFYTQELEQCAVPDNIFKNENYMAKHRPIREKDVYYDWLGYIDIFQEMYTVVSKTEFGTIEEYVENNLEESGFTNLPPALQKDYLLKTGLSSVNTRFPTITCDDLEIAKLNPAVQAENRLSPNINPTCIAAISDDSYEDKLGAFLCEKGYYIKGIPGCEKNNPLQCVPSTKYNNAVKEYNQKPYTGDACPQSECPAQLAAGVGGVGYPYCNEGIQTSGTGANVPGACDYWENQNKYFGPLSDVSSNLVSLSALSRGQDGDGFLGMNASIPIHNRAAPIFLRAEQEFNRLYGQNRNGPTYYLPSYPNGYTFQFARSYSPGSSLGNAPSNHAWGVAIDINATTNWGNFRPQERQCMIDIPPELVQVFEAHGIRWGGRYAKRGFTGGNGYFDPMHFEIVPDCAPELINIPGPINPLPGGLPIDVNSCPVETQPESDKEYDTIFHLIQTVSSSTGVPKEMIAAVMSTEARSDFQQSIGQFIQEDNALYSGDPYDSSNINSGEAVGPMQFTLASFNAIKARPDLYTPVLGCVSEIGMQETTPDQLQRELVGHALCMGAIWLKHISEVESVSISSINDNYPNGFDETNPIWKVSRRYYCGYVEENGGQCSLGNSYGNQIWGRTLVLLRFWDRFTSGQYGSNELYNYIITLEQ